MRRCISTGSTASCSVLAAVRRIPPGRVSTHGDIAARAGGAIGGDGGSVRLKRELLRTEALEVGRARVRRFSAVRWRGTAPRAHEPAPRPI
jgi:O6-methylguanine-DNA--protein-cysteine methyltransferase